MGSWLLSTLLFLSGTSDAQIHWSPPGVIVVNAVSRDLSPVAGAAVSLYRAESPAAEPLKTGATNAGGHIEFRGLAAGAYLIRIRLSGYLDMSFGPVPVEEKTPASVRIPEILAVMNPVMAF
jgi:hypothetical protein